MAEPGEKLASGSPVERFSWFPHRREGLTNSDIVNSDTNPKEVPSGLQERKVDTGQGARFPISPGGEPHFPPPTCVSRELLSPHAAGIQLWGSGQSKCFTSSGLAPAVRQTPKGRGERAMACMQNLHQAEWIGVLGLWSQITTSWIA